jgi:hypothetical protein
MSKMFGDLLEKTSPVKVQKLVGPEPTMSQETGRSLEKTDRLPTQRSNERPNEGLPRQTDERKRERTKVRHSFDVFRDQILDLGDIQQALAREQGTKPRLGDLVQEALDNYIKARRNQRTNQRSDDGMKESENDSTNHGTLDGTNAVPLPVIDEGSRPVVDSLGS